ncbi:MAG: hypothetical protein MJ240_12435 [Kiritimatiellae bacterium]|nr:hypothetical protein [Kiritimatiellia bacterium]
MRRVIPSLAFAYGLIGGVQAGGLSITTNDCVATVYNDSGVIQTVTTPFLAPDVASVIFFAQPQIMYAPTQASTYTGGTVVQRGQVFVAQGDVFGSGSITLGTTEEAALLARDVDVAVPNKVIFARSTSYVNGFTQNEPGKGRLTLTSVGTPADATSHAIRLGRSNGNPSRVTLALTDPDSEAISRINVLGALDLVLAGGTIKARADAESPFLFKAVAGDSAVKVSANGVSFEAASGANVSLGHPLVFQEEVCTNVLETLIPENSSFESGAVAPWQLTHGVTKDSEVRTAPCPFDDNGAYPPLSGTKYLKLRTGASASLTLTVPTEGLWRVVYDRGGRNTQYSADMITTVTLNGTVVQVLPKNTDVAFTTYRSAALPFAAGESCQVTLAAGGSSDSLHTINVDNIFLERISTETRRGTWTKTGAGTLCVANQTVTRGQFAVTEGTLAFQETELVETPVTVSAEARVELRGATLVDENVLNVAANAVLAFSPFAANQLANPGFEAQQQSFGPTVPTGWSFQRGADLQQNPDCGLIRKGDTVLGGLVPPEGNEAIYLRETSRVSQRFDVAESGTYRISFAQANRQKYYKSHTMPVMVLMDDEVVLTVSAHGADYDFEYQSVDVALTGGTSHVLRIACGTTASPVQGEMVFIDDVRVCRVVPQRNLDQGVVALRTGSILQLDNETPVAIANVTVDGVKIAHGHRAALVRAGVVVQGEGDVVVGTPYGTTILLR